MRESVPRPVPDVGPQAITGEQYEAFTPEKLELWSGYLINAPERPTLRRNLLLLLLTNEGLAEALRLAPEERWRAAMQQVFGR